MEVLTKNELIEFEDEIKELYLGAKIKAPVHFSKGNEDPLIEVFKNINEEDWVFSTHRNHYHALLKGLPKEYIKQEILKGKSMHINNQKYKFFTSSIVGGSLPIALGTAMGIKRKGLDEKVWCFVGDMAAEMGVFHECTKYAEKNNLPINFVVEDNGLSINTPTKEAWGLENSNANMIRYKYDRGYPHHGCGTWVNF
jgi:TPP-dependent pyruvate/acetoin dehydrogenase alpha subunit